MKGLSARLWECTKPVRDLFSLVVFVVVIWTVLLAAIRSMRALFEFEKVWVILMLFEAVRELAKILHRASLSVTFYASKWLPVRA